MDHIRLSHICNIAVYVALSAVFLMFVRPVYASCLSPTGSTGTVLFNEDHNVMQYCDSGEWIAFPEPDSSATSDPCPEDETGSVVFNADHRVLQWCDGAQWIAAGPVDPGGPNEGCTDPAGTGGSLIFNTNLSVLQYCDGDLWRPISKTSFSTNCTLPWGDTIQTGQNATAWEAATVVPPTTCSSETRECSLGELSGSFEYESCEVVCALPWGGEISDGDSVTAYRCDGGGGCESQLRTCDNGTLLGDASYEYETCVTAGCPRSCDLPWGGSIAHNDSVTGYKLHTWTGADWTGCNAQCRNTLRECYDGSLSGFTYDYPTCNDAATAANLGSCPASCGALQVQTRCSNHTNRIFEETITNDAAACRARCEQTYSACCQYYNDSTCSGYIDSQAESTISSLYYGASCN